MSDPQTRIEWLMTQHQPPFRSKKAASTAYKIEYETFKKLLATGESERRGLTMENALKIAKYHGVSVGWLMFGEGQPDLGRGIRLEGKIGAGQEMMVFENPGNEDPISPDIVGPDALALEVEGDSMRPLARDGDIIFVGPARRDIRSLIGEECAVLLEDGRRFFKIIETGAKPGRYDLISHNAAPIRDVEIHSAGPFLALKRRAAKIRRRN